MSDLSELYQEIILDHNRAPRNFGELAQANRHADGNNPLCGDQVSVTLLVDGDTIVDAAFKGRGCAISTASASLMTEMVKGKTVAEAEALFARFHRLLTGDAGEAAQTESDLLEGELGKLAALAGVRDYPSRVKCATLAWHTLEAALTETEDTVTTE